MNLRDIYAKNKTLEDHNATSKLLAHIATMTQMNEAPDSGRGRRSRSPRAPARARSAIKPPVRTLLPVLPHVVLRRSVQAAP